MARIAGVDLPREKRIEIGLTYVYGIGRVRATKILAEAGVNPDTRVKDLTDEEVAKIAKVIDADPEHLVEGDLRREVAMNIKRLQEIGCYRGIRHRKGLPVRGQKTKKEEKKKQAKQAKDKKPKKEKKPKKVKVKEPPKPGDILKIKPKSIILFILLIAGIIMLIQVFGYSINYNSKVNAAKDYFINGEYEKAIKSF